ncbi:DUF3592 domain-containing protein [Intrasporangium sp.]|uniref:DUF3592 domain-containing protein n=1 Tax=Intrasporangium sp. TaxID=1925024 RepID=UPI0033653D2E
MPRRNVPHRRSSRFAAIVNSPKVVTWLLVLAALGCGSGAFVAHRAATTLQDQGQQTVGEVVDVHDALRGDGYVVIRFQDTAGREITAEVGNYRWDPHPQVGDRPAILYDPADPAGNVADVRMGPDLFSVWALPLGGLLAALVWPTWTGRLDWDKLG